jgi:transposase
MAEVPPASPVPADATVEQLLALLAERDRMIERLVERTTQLEAGLGRNWQNSSQPPSADTFVKPPPRSLRGRSGRKPGKSDG